MKHLFALLLCLSLALFARGYRDRLEGLVYETEDWTTPKEAWLLNGDTAGKWCLWTEEPDVWSKRSNGASIKTPFVKEDRQTPEEGAPVLHTHITGIPKGFYQVFQSAPNRALAISQDGGKTWRKITGHGEIFLGFYEINDGTFELWVDDRYVFPEGPGSAYYDYIRMVPTTMPNLSGLTAFTLPSGQTQLSWMSSTPLPAASVQFRLAGQEAWLQFPEPKDNMRNHFAVLPKLEEGKNYQARVLVMLNAHKQLASNILTFIAGAKPVPSKTKQQTIPLKVHERAKTGRSQWFVRNGIPFAQGVLASQEDVQLTTDGGKAVPASFEVMSRWPDGSVKWLIVQTWVDTRPAQDTFYKLVLQDGIGRGKAQTATSLDGSRYFDFDAMESLLTLGDGTVCKMDTEHVLCHGTETKLANGRSFTETTYQGDYVNPKGERMFSWRIELGGAGSQRQLRYSICNNVPNRNDVAVKSLSFSFKDKDIGRDVFTTSDGVALKAGSSIRQFTEKQAVVTVRGASQTQEHFDGFLRCQFPNAFLVLKDFWQTYPKGIDIADDKLTFWILPELPQGNYPPQGWDNQDEFVRHWYWYDKGCYRFRRGVEISTDFFMGNLAPSNLDAQWFQSPLFLAASPEYYCATGAFGPLLPMNDTDFPEYEKAFWESFKQQQESRQARGEYGWMNYGDWFGERRYNWGDNEYDMGYTCAIHFARSGDLDLLERGAQMERHYTTVDVDHCPAPAMSELVYGHCCGHVGNFVPPGDPRRNTFKGLSWFLNPMHDKGHAHMPGMYYYACLLGDKRMWKVAEDCAWTEAMYCTPNFSFPIERAAGWPLINAMYAYQFTGNPYYLNAARLYFEKVSAIQNPEHGGFDLAQDQLECDCPDKAEHRGGKAFATGVLLHGLIRLYEATHDEQVKASIAGCARWLLDTSWNERKMGFRYKTGCPKYANQGWYAIIVAEGIAYATEITGDRRYIDFLHRTMGNELRKVTGNYIGCGKEFSQFNRHTPHVLYYLKKYGYSTIPLPVQRQEGK